MYNRQEEFGIRPSGHADRYGPDEPQLTVAWRARFCMTLIRKRNLFDGRNNFDVIQNRNGRLGYWAADPRRDRAYSIVRVMFNCLAVPLEGLRSVLPVINQYNSRHCMRKSKAYIVKFARMFMPYDGKNQIAVVGGKAGWHSYYHFRSGY